MFFIDFDDPDRRERESEEIRRLVKDINRSEPIGITSIEFLKPVIVTEIVEVQNIMRLYSARLKMVEKILNDYNEKFIKHFNNTKSSNECNDLLSQLNVIKHLFNKSREDDKAFVWMKVDRGI